MTDIPKQPLKRGVFNKTFFRFVFGFLGIVLVSIILTNLVTQYDTGAEETEHFVEE